MRLALALLVVLVANHVFSNDVRYYFSQAADIGWAHLPYRDFLWEFPPLASAVLLLIPLTVYNIVAFQLAFAAVMISAEYASLEVLRRARPDHAWSLTKFWTVAVLPVATIAWFRLDFLTTLVAAIGVVALVGGRSYASPAVAGIGLKLWPAVFGIAMLVERQWKQIAVTVGGVAAVFGAWFAYSPEGVRTFVEYRQGDGFQVESIPGMLLLLAGRPHEMVSGAVVVSDAGFEWVQVAMQVLFVAVPLVVTGLAMKRGANNVNLVALLAAVLCVMLLASRLFSPQFLVWLAPFVAWLWPYFRRQGQLYVVATVLTFVIIQFYSAFLTDNQAVIWVGIVRNAVMALLTIELFRIAFKNPSTTGERTYGNITH